MLLRKKWKGKKNNHENTECEGLGSGFFRVLRGTGIEIDTRNIPASSNFSRLDLENVILALRGYLCIVAAMFFTPSWKKEALLLLKSGKKFLNYKRDILKPDRVDEIQSRIADLKNAISEKNREKISEAGKQLNATCEKALPYQKPQSWLEENVEVMFVALVVALGLRSYFLQPFRIPTGSMQPTLNGIIVTPAKDGQKFEKPWIGKQVYDYVSHGRSWRNITAPTSGRLRTVLTTDGPKIAAEDTSILFISRSKVYFENGTTMTFPAPPNATSDALDHLVNKSLKQGEPMYQGTIDSGDLVLVNKFAYHFRKPERGEVFVFDTIGLTPAIDRSLGKSSNLKDQQKATHYIKRLCGLPGDTLKIESPYLYVNGAVAKEKGIEHVFTFPNSRHPSLKGYSNERLLGTPTDEFHLPEKAPAGMRGYAALGDNSGNSLDSRFWGQVNEYNLVGPALFSLWPITTGHWGFIK